MPPHDIPNSDDLLGLEAMEPVIQKKVFEKFDHHGSGSIFAIGAEMSVIPVG